MKSDAKLAYDEDISVFRENTDLRMQERIKEYEETVKRYKDDPWMYDYLPPVTEEKKEVFVSLIEKISTPQYFNSSIRMILDEEIPFFFDGSKSADDVSKTIQNRVSTLLSES
ncbi:MAG: hypothetical protein IKZ90_04350 [Clostridiales bacterium]|nr:hypothetical protein [Clostridiales bacterium]